eukprot:jgi/Mesvir1/17978/Mv09324-RA.1
MPESGGETFETRVYSWGAGEDGQLGHGTTDDVHVPQVVETFNGLEVTQVVGGSRNSLALTSKGEVYSWGWNKRGTLGHGHNSPEPLPRPILALSHVCITQVAIGGWHCLAVDEDGQMYSWGGNEYAQCGLSSDAGKDICSPVPCLTQHRIAQVSAGGMHSLALTREGHVWCWGQPLGAVTNPILRLPHRVNQLSNIVQIACGAFHNLVLRELEDDKGGRRHEVLSWGLAEYGQLGLGPGVNVNEPQLIPELIDKEIREIAAGGWHSLAMSASGQVYIWGRGEYGRLGLGDDQSRVHPRLLQPLVDEGVVATQISGGGTHTAVLSKNHELYLFGRGDFGRLGTGTLQDFRFPQRILMPFPKCDDSEWVVEQVSCGGRHTLALAVRYRRPHRSAGSDNESNGSCDGDDKNDNGRDSNGKGENGTR